jgi:uncharacterized membrane protein (DUF4010 family)
MDANRMEPAALYQKFGLALGLGLLVGLQRERSASALAGFRTFPIVTMLGTLTGVLTAAQGWALSAAGLLALGAICVMGNVTKLRAGTLDPGLTTESALLLMYCLGVFIALGPASVAVVIGALVASLLYLKPQLHGLAKKIGDNDFRGIMQFVAIALVILPLVPDVPLGPYGALNPRRIWWLVVLLTGISLAGYLAYRFCPAESGTLLAGVLGGLISSTATTVTFARRTRHAAGAERSAALVILLAGTIVFARVLVLVAVATPGFFAQIAPPVAIMLGFMLLISAILWWRAHGEKIPLPEQQNPTELRAALVFTVLFALVFIATAFARERLGNSGLYAVAAISGLTDMDAITVSSAQLANSSTVPPQTVWQLILVAAMANMVFKTVMVAAIGSRALLGRVALCFATAIAGGVALMLFWR